MPLDTAETWLDFAALVFIDPPATGYSRITGGDDARRQLLSVDGDIEMLAVVMRRWLESHGRLLAPKFIVGESYGGFRGPKLARVLLDRQGIGVSGLVLISPVLDFNGRDAAWNPLRYVVALPSLAAAARNASGEAAVADAEAYARGDFLQDLMRGESDVASVERISGRVASPYDGTLSAIDPFPAAVNDNSPDPLLDGMRGPLTSAMLYLYRTRLEWQPEGAPSRQYEILNEGVARDWDYGRRMNRPEAYSELRQYLALDPVAGRSCHAVFRQQAAGRADTVLWPGGTPAGAAHLWRRAHVLLARRIPRGAA